MFCRHCGRDNKLVKPYCLHLILSRGFLLRTVIFSFFAAQRDEIQAELTALLLAVIPGGTRPGCSFLDFLVMSFLKAVANIQIMSCIGDLGPPYGGEAI